MNFLRYLERAGEDALRIIHDPPKRGLYWATQIAWPESIAYQSAGGKQALRFNELKCKNRNVVGGTSKFQILDFKFIRFQISNCAIGLFGFNVHDG